MRIRIQTTYDGAPEDWQKIYVDGKLVLEGRNLTIYEFIRELSEKYPELIQLEPLRAFGYMEVAA